MQKDIVIRLDELLAFAGAIAGGLTAKRSNTASPEIQSELNMLYTKVHDLVKDMTSLTTEKNTKKLYKKAVQVVIKREGLNKNWGKLLKQHVKKYSK
jgi:outer membrane lipoprotein-sorting protein